MYNVAKHDEIMTKIQFTGTETQPQCNRNATGFFVNLIMTRTTRTYLEIMLVFDWQW